MRQHGLFPPAARAAGMAGRTPQVLLVLLMGPLPGGRGAVASQLVTRGLTQGSWSVCCRLGACGTART